MPNFNRRALLILLAVAAVLQTSVGARELQDSPVIEWITVQTDGNLTQYLEAMKPILHRAMELDDATSIRIYEADLAGESSGNIYVAIESPNMIAIATHRAQALADNEIQEYLSDLKKTGRRTVSRSLLIDRTPDSVSTKSSAKAARGKMVEVITVDPAGSTTEYLQALEPVLLRAMEVDPKVRIRVYEALFAGESAGKVYVTVESPSFQAMAEGRTRVYSDAEFLQRVENLAKTGRVVLSRSQLADRTP